MKRAAMLLFWVCIGFGDPTSVIWFLNGYKPIDARLVVSRDGQYQVFYRTDKELTVLKCPNGADCVYLPQACQ